MCFIITCWNKNVNVNPYVYNPPYKNIIGTYIIPTVTKRGKIFSHFHIF